MKTLNILSNFFHEDNDYNLTAEKEIGGPIIEADYDSIKTEIGVDLRPSFHEVTSLHDSFKFLLLNDDLVVSECVIDGIIMTFNDFSQEHYIHAFDEFGESFIKFARQFYPLDIYEKATDEVTLTVVKPISDSNNEIEFWIWNNSGQKYKLRFQSFLEYLIAGISCKFCVFWQYFYIDIDSMNLDDPFTNEWLAQSFSEAINRSNFCLESMNRFFSDYDWSMQEKELERLKNL